MKTKNLRQALGILDEFVQKFQTFRPDIIAELDAIDNGQTDPIPDPEPDPNIPDPLPLPDIDRNTLAPLKKKSPFTVSVPHSFYQNVPTRIDPSTADKFEKVDIWIPENGKNDIPLVLYIHGGGFHSYDKNVVYKERKGIDVAWDFPKDINTLLVNGIAFASLGYAKLDIENPSQSRSQYELMQRLLYSFQFIKYYAKGIGLNPERIIITGISAGAFFGHWVHFSPDMAKPASLDAIERVSTKPFTTAARFAHATEDIDVWENDIFKEYNFNLEEFFSRLAPAQQQLAFKKYQAAFGITSISDMRSERIKNEFLKMNGLRFLSENTEEFWFANYWSDRPKNNNELGHHGNHARYLHEFATQKGAPHTIYWGLGEKQKYPINAETWMEFVLRKAKE